MIQPTEFRDLERRLAYLAGRLCKTGCDWADWNTLIGPETGTKFQVRSCRCCMKSERRPFTSEVDSES